MEEHKSKWWAKMIATHGSEEAVRNFMRQSANKSKRNTGGTGGFAAMDKDTLREISARAGKASAEKRIRQKET